MDISVLLPVLNSAFFKQEAVLVLGPRHNIDPVLDGAGHLRHEVAAVRFRHHSGAPRAQAHKGAFCQSVLHGPGMIPPLPSPNATVTHTPVVHDWLFLFSRINLFLAAVDSTAPCENFRMCFQPIRSTLTSTNRFATAQATHLNSEYTRAFVAFPDHVHINATVEFIWFCPQTECHFIPQGKSYMTILHIN